MLWLRKLAYRFYRGITSARYWAGRRLTPAGLAVVGGLVVSGTLGMDMERSVVYQVFTMLAGLLAVAWLGSRFFRGRFHAERHLPRFGTVGQPLVYHLALRNDTSSAQTGLALLEELADPRPTFAEFAAQQIAEEKEIRAFRISRRTSRWHFEMATVKETPIPPLPAGQETEVRVELLPLRRGCVRFRGITVARPDPLGLVKSFVRLPLPQSVLILPKRYRLPELALPGASAYQQGGVALASSIGESEEFVSLRDYRPGDPLRHIHWRTWARAGRPIVKEFEDEFFVRHALILDTFIAHPNSEVFEEAVSVAASFACTIPTQESLLDLLFVGPQAYCFTAGRGLAHADQMLEILASVRACGDSSFAELENLVLNHVGRVSGCICVLLAWDERRRRFVEKLRHLGIPLWIFVITDAGGAAKLEPGPLRDQPGTFHALEVGAIQEGLAVL